MKALYQPCRHRIRELESALREIYEVYAGSEELGGNNDWQESPGECARVLRLYATKYHTPKQTELPDSVRYLSRARHRLKQTQSHDQHQ